MPPKVNTTSERSALAVLLDITERQQARLDAQGLRIAELDRRVRVWLLVSVSAGAGCVFGLLLYIWSGVTF